MYQPVVIQLDMGIHNRDGYLYDMTGVPITYGYTGGMQSYKAAYSGIYKLEAWGAQGGNADNGANGSFTRAYGGLGGYSKGEIFLSAGETIYIFVGQQGGWGGSSLNPVGGWNGGGNAQNHGGASGGGATDARRSGQALANRIIVAGAGGGAQTMNTSYSPANGGDGGGLTGGSAKSTGYWSTGYYGTGGSQSNGGTYSSGWGTIPSIPGSLGQGGNAYSSYSGGGGGGYYGGCSARVSWLFRSRWLRFRRRFN